MSTNNKGTSKAFDEAREAATRYLERQSDDPHLRHDALVKVIIHARIVEFEHARKFMCPKCQASYSAARREGR